MLTWPRAHTACTILEGKVQNGSERIPIVVDKRNKTLYRSLWGRVKEQEPIKPSSIRGNLITGVITMALQLQESIAKCLIF